MIAAHQALRLVVTSVGLTLALYGVTLIPQGARDISRLETIASIPYAFHNSAVHIDEPLAHADLYLGQPVFAQELVLTVEFVPVHITALSVGVRENSFWLSYPQLPVCCSKNQDSSASWRTKIQTTVTIPLTDKLQEPDQSVDLMFFAEGEQPLWQLVSVKAETRSALPSWAQFKDYARAILYRERAL